MPGAVVGFTASVEFFSVTFTWAPPSFLGVPATLDPAGIIYYILDVRNDTASVGGATVPHPTTTVMVNLTYPCEEYTATIFARNIQAGNGPTTTETFTLNETSVCHLRKHPASVECAAFHWDYLASYMYNNQQTRGQICAVATVCLH